MSIFWNDLRIVVKQYITDKDTEKCIQKLEELTKQHEYRQRFNNTIVLLGTIERCFNKHYALNQEDKLGKTFVNAALRDDYMYYQKYINVELKQSDHDTLYHSIRKLFKNIVEYYAEPWMIKDCLSEHNKKIVRKNLDQSLSFSIEYDFTELP